MDCNNQLLFFQLLVLSNETPPWKLHAPLWPFGECLPKLGNYCYDNRIDQILSINYMC